MSNNSNKHNVQGIWTPSNVITVLRICLVPVFVVALLSPWPMWFGIKDLITNDVKSIIAAGIFILISCTDWVDGYLARKRNEVTDFGKFADPLADKILVVAALLALIELRVLPSWPVLIILIREFIVSGIRMIAASKGIVIAASWYGKAKTVFQIIAIVLFLVKDSLYLPTSFDALHNPLYVISWIVMVIALALTVISMLDYIAKAAPLLGFAGSADSKNKNSSKTHVETSCRAVFDKKTLDLAEEVIDKAKLKNVKIGTAESLTGGLISSALTAIPGSSVVVQGGISSYSLDVKSNVLGVDDGVLNTDGAVCAKVAEQMAFGAAQRLGADVVISVTGIAGPGGAEPNKPVGTVWMGLFNNGSVESRMFLFDGDRSCVRMQTVDQALLLMSEVLS